jgi:hypothetical protein
MKAEAEFPALLRQLAEARELGRDVFSRKDSATVDEVERAREVLAHTIVVLRHFLARHAPDFEALSAVERTQFSAAMAAFREFATSIDARASEEEVARATAEIRRTPRPTEN